MLPKEKVGGFLNFFIFFLTIGFLNLYIDFAMDDSVGGVYLPVNEFCLVLILPYLKIILFFFKEKKLFVSHVVLI